MKRGKQIGNSKNQGFNSPKSNQDIYSKAPYNFVPLNEKVVIVDKIPDFDKYHPDRYTGYIDIEIEALTPLYIRDTLTEQEYKEKIEIEKEGKQYINPDFFSPGGLPRIPGSSLRGMIRTMVEIMSFGKFGFFEDLRLYYRALDISKLGEDYRNKMADTKNYNFPKFKAGLLRKNEQNKYEILPSKKIKGTQIYRINFDKKTGIIDGTRDFKLEEFEFKTIYFNPTPPEDHLHKRIDKRTKEEIPYKLRYAKLTSISLTEDESHPNKGYIISSGHVDKKHMHWVINEPDELSQPIEIDEDVVNSYKNDKQRKAPDLIKKLNEVDQIPCFYLTDPDGRIIFFGHTGYFRLAYDRTIGDHIPSSLKNQNIIDIAEAIFGNEKQYSSRVFFEDAYLSENSAKEIYPPTIPKILSSPKPTCFQHYLEQKPENLKDHPKNLAHYNSDNPIRGYKIYWHRSGNNYKAEEISYDEKEFEALLKEFKESSAELEKFIIEKKSKKIKLNLRNMPQSLKEIIIQSIGNYESQHTLLKVINRGSKFYGRIRFENLSNVELGALLFALDLPKGLAHKIGMGKPLGLGSIKITPRLYLSNRRERYENLTSEWDGMIEETKKIPEFKDAFEGYVLKSMKENKHSLWDLERMRQLRKMLNFENKPSDEKTEYLDLTEFRKRKVLPKPTEIG